MFLLESSSNTGQLRMQGGPKERFDISHLSDGITVNDLEQVHVYSVGKRLEYYHIVILYTSVKHFELIFSS